MAVSDEDMAACGRPSGIPHPKPRHYDFPPSPRQEELWRPPPCFSKHRVSEYNTSSKHINRTPDRRTVYTWRPPTPPRPHARDGYRSIRHQYVYYHKNPLQSPYLLYLFNITCSSLSVPIRKKPPTPPPLPLTPSTMSGLEKSLFNLKFTAKQLNRQAAKAGKDETAEKNKLKKVYPFSPITFAFSTLPALPANNFFLSPSRLSSKTTPT